MGPIAYFLYKINVKYLFHFTVYVMKVNSPLEAGYHVTRGLTDISFLVELKEHATDNLIRSSET